MRLWRLCRRPHVRLDGEGARRWGGRWNHPGVAVIYASGTLSLAMLELLVHVPDAATAPDDLVAVPLDCPARMPPASMRQADLPPDWTSFPAPGALADLGTAWVRGGETLILSVPSVVLPQGPERNYLINPAHPAFSGIRAGKPFPVALDPRFWSTRTRVT